MFLLLFLPYHITGMLSCRDSSFKHAVSN